jgi:membrane protease YdiL (CAAX protease family)
MIGHTAANILVNLVGSVVAPDAYVKITSVVYMAQGDAEHISNMLVYVVLIVFIMCMFKLLFRKPLVQMGFGMSGAARKFFGGLLFGAACMAVIFAVLYLLGGLTIDSVSPGRLARAGALWGIGVFFVAALHEETLIRGFMMSAFRSTRLRLVIIFAPALLFALAHLSNEGFTSLALFNIFLAGILLAILFLRSGSLWAPFGFHFAWNFCQGNIFGINVSGLESDSLIDITYTKRVLLNGGDFGAEGGLAVTVVLAIVIVLTMKFMPIAKDAQWSLTPDTQLTRRVFPDDEAPGDGQTGQNGT